MKRLFFLLTVAISIATITNAQNYFTKNGKISFFSKTSMENIEAVNNQVVSVLNSAKGDLGFSVLIKGFIFKKELMQEHFNENYMESEKYPKATFKGTITDLSKVTFSKDGTYPVSVKGDMTLHGITKNVTTAGSITIKAGKIAASSTFNLLLADYKIEIPKVVENNISKTIEIKVDCNYEAK